ncbi:hypothetical protein KP509_02G087100 [Ceratopteris richardii]|uniref:Glutaredoxin domain-containing protein n=1 Tax=Ceratopteris richardii TaxID=49495 RepID=A0A8T2VFE1_CERRI|nr:hypothetical protein KP509_02G087100 [Ceratopteris richardii]
MEQCSSSHEETMASDQLEGVNIWELMSRLHDDESYADSESLPYMSSFKAMATSTAQIGAKHTLELFNLNSVHESITTLQSSVLNVLYQRRPKSSNFLLEDQSTSYAARSPEKWSQDNICPSDGGPVLNSAKIPLCDFLADSFRRSLSFKLASHSGNNTLKDQDSETCDAETLFKGLADHPSNSSCSKVVRTSTSIFTSASAKLRKWFKVNKEALSLQKALKIKLKHIRTSLSVIPTPNLAPSEKTMDKYLDHSNGNGTCANLTEDSSSTSGSDDFSETINGSLCATGTSTKNTDDESGQSDDARFYGHSHSTEERSRWSRGCTSAGINSPSSWELEKIFASPVTTVVLYTTNLRTDIDAYEDSNAARAILISLMGADFNEKSVSKNPFFEQELKVALNLPVVQVPTVCIKGKYIPGIDNIMQLFKKGILNSLLLEALPDDFQPKASCMCRGGKFLICPVCRGKCKISRHIEGPVPCRHCSGTGLLKCPNCQK